MNQILESDDTPNRAIQLVSRTGKKRQPTGISFYYFPCVFTVCFVFFFEFALCMNLEKANGTPSTNVKRPYMMHTLDMSCPALTKMGRNDETIKKDEVIQ